MLRSNHHVAQSKDSALTIGEAKIKSRVLTMLELRDYREFWTENLDSVVQVILQIGRTPGCDEQTEFGKAD